MSSLKIKQINNAGTVPNSCIAFDGMDNVWRKLFHLEEFTVSDLDTNGVLTVSHTLGRKYVAIAVYDNQDLLIIPDQVKAIDANTTSITLSSFKDTMASATWTVSVS